MSIKRQTLWSILPLLITSIFGVVTVPIFLHSLGPEMYALWFYVATFSGMFGFADFGLGVAVGRYVGVALGQGDVETARQFWGTGNAAGLPLLAVTCLLFAIVGATYGPQWFNAPRESYASLRLMFVMAAAGIFASYYANFWNALAQAHLHFGFLSCLKTIHSLASTLPAVLIAWLTHDAVPVVAWSVAANTLMLFAFMIYTRRSYGWGLELSMASREKLRIIAPLALKTLGSLFVGSFLFGIDRFLLGRLAAPVVFTNYSIASQLAQKLQVLSSAMMGPIANNSTRRVGSHGISAAGEIYDESLRFLFGWIALAVVWAQLWATPVLTLWLGAEAGPNVALVFKFLIGAYAFMAIANIGIAQLPALDRVGTGIYFNVLVGICTAVGVIVGWRHDGVRGAACGVLLGRAAYFAQDFFVIRMGNADAWKMPALWREIAFQTPVALVFLGISTILPGDPWWQAGAGVLHGSLVAVRLIWHLVSEGGNLSDPTESKAIPAQRIP